jgi:GR25 family glycosyltransferase involved in LPS biosynthesis
MAGGVVIDGHFSPSDIEIFKSHIDCWKKISLSGEVGIVLEDDLIFFKEFLRKLLNP